MPKTLDGIWRAHDNDLTCTLLSYQVVKSLRWMSGCCVLTNV